MPDFAECRRADILLSRWAHTLESFNESFCQFQNPML